MPDRGEDFRNITLKRQLPKANLHKILAIKFFRITDQIHKGCDSLFIKALSSSPLQISTRFNCRFKDAGMG